MPLTNDDQISAEENNDFYDDLMLAVTSPLFIKISETLGVHSVIEFSRQVSNGKIRKDDTKIELDKLLSKLDTTVFFEKLDKKSCPDILQFVEDEFEKRIKGQEELLHLLLISVVMNEHALLEGLPGVGKTEIVKWIAYVTGLPFSRVQFIPDMLPSDLIGKDKVDLLLLEKGDENAIDWVNGPIFSGLVLADEINRAPSKVQAALLEAMGENQVTPFGKAPRPIYSNIHAAALEIWHENQEHFNNSGIFGLPLITLDRTDLAQFTVFATMNPIEQEGTYPLSEAQTDRFCFKIVVPYPDRKKYKEISEVMFGQERQIKAIKGKLPIETYKNIFKKNKNFMIPILAPIYFLLRCRSYIIPVIMGEQLEVGNTLYEKLHSDGEILDKLYDIVLMTNAKNLGAELSASTHSRYDIEQIEMRRFIDEIAAENGNGNMRHINLKRALDLPHCQYVLAGASPRGFSSLESSTLCKAFIKGSMDVTSRDIITVAKSILRHRIHMDVHARLAGITSLDVINNVCNVILEE